MDNSGFVGNSSSPIQVCRKTEVMGCVGLADGTSSVLFSSRATCWWGAGTIPNKAAWGMPESPLDPPSKFPFRRDWPSALCAGSYTNEDDSTGPPSAMRVGSPSSHVAVDGHWCDGWAAGNISHIQGPACNALSAGGWQWCLSFWPSFLHQGQWVSLLKWWSTSRSCMPINPITFRGLG